MHFQKINVCDYKLLMKNQWNLNGQDTVFAAARRCQTAIISSETFQSDIYFTVPWFLKTVNERILRCSENVWSSLLTLTPIQYENENVHVQ